MAKDKKLSKDKQLFKDILDLYLKGKSPNVIGDELLINADFVKETIDDNLDLINGYIKKILPVSHHEFLTDNCLHNVQVLLTIDESTKYTDYMLDLAMRKALVTLLEQSYTDKIPNPSRASVTVALINNIFKKGSDV